MIGISCIIVEILVREVEFTQNTPDDDQLMKFPMNTKENIL